MVTPNEHGSPQRPAGEPDAPSLTVSCVADEQDLLLAACSGAIARNALLWNESPEDVLGDEIFSRKILLDVSNADRIDSAGVSWLIRFHRRCQEAGGQLIIHSTPPVIDKTLKLLNMGMVLKVAESEQAARQVAGASD